MKKVTRILEQHDVYNEALVNELQDFGKYKFDEGFTFAREQAEAKIETLRKALIGFINPTGHTDVCLELREFGNPICNRNCRTAREAIEKATGKPIVLSIYGENE